MDEQFRGEEAVDEEGRNATQQRVAEEGTVWKDVGPADVDPDEAAQRAGEGIGAWDDDTGQVIADS